MRRALWVAVACAASRAAPPDPFAPAATTIVLSTPDDLGRRRRRGIVAELAAHGRSAIVVEGIAGDNFALRAVGAHEVEASLGPLVVRAWDWRSGRGVGDVGAGPFARILACAASHVAAIARARAANRWPALVVEDDVELAKTAPGELEAAVACANATHPTWQLAQAGYLAPSARFAAARAAPGVPRVARRDACSADFRIVGLQAYLVSEAGAARVLDALWPPGLPFGAPLAGTLDLRVSVNPAADYLLFAVAPDAVTLRRPVFVEAESARESALFPGVRKPATADAAFFGSHLLDDAVGAGACPRQNPPVLEPASYGVLWGSRVVRAAAGAAPRDAVEEALGPVAALEAEILDGCAAACGAPSGLLLPSPLQCWRVPLDDVCAAADARTSTECATLRAAASALEGLPPGAAASIDRAPADGALDGAFAAARAARGVAGPAGAAAALLHYADAARLVGDGAGARRLAWAAARAATRDGFDALERSAAPDAPDAVAAIVDRAAAAARGLDAAARAFGLDAADVPSSLCGPYRVVSDLFKGPAAPALAAVHGAADPRSARAAVAAALARAADHPSRGFRDLAAYASASLDATVLAGLWDPRAFAPLEPLDEAAGRAGALSALAAVFRPARLARAILPASDDLLVVAVASARTAGLAALERSAARAGVALEVLGLGLDPYAHDLKLRLLDERLETVADATLVLFVDAYDVLLLPKVARLPRAFREAGHAGRVVFAAERACWPDAAVCEAWFGNGPYLNSGAFAGAAADLRRMLAHLKGPFAYCGGDDQRSYQRFLVEAPDLAALDVDAALFLATHGASWSVDVLETGQPVFYALEGGERAKSSTPAVVHFNSHDGKAMLAALLPHVDG